MAESLRSDLGGSLRAFFRLSGDDEGDESELGTAASFTVTLIGKYELALAEWGKDPDDLLDNWTDERFEWFWNARNKRMIAGIKAMKAGAEISDGSSETASTRVSDMDLFSMMGIQPQSAGRA